MSKKAARSSEDPEWASPHCLTDMPYRMIVYHRSNGPTPLFLVAGSNAEATGAKKALREAHRLHGGNCFYCRKPVPAGELSIDHVEPEKLKGRISLQNLVIACRPCNKQKRDQPIEAFKPDAGREWLMALMEQVQDRLNRIEEPRQSRTFRASSPPRPTQAAKAGP